MRAAAISRVLTAALALASASPAASATAAAASPGQVDDLTLRLLAAHNQERAAVGAPPLHWDPNLASAAASYGPALARMGLLIHSPRETRPGQRENLAMAWTDATSPESLFQSWANEKALFRPGAFPQVSRTGQWLDVAHYTQMIWKGTTHVGCAIHDANGWSYLICRYSPPGNIDGRVVP